MKEISLPELNQLLKENPALKLVDVREPYEHEAFNIGGQLIPLGDIISRAEEIVKDEPVIVYCRKGVRSAIAIQRLEEKFGFQNLINLSGGVG